MTTIATINSETNNIATQSIQSVINSSGSGGGSSFNVNTATITFPVETKAADITKWEEKQLNIEPLANRQYIGIFYRNGIYFIYGFKIFVYSTDGVNWYDLNKTMSDLTMAYDHMCYADGKYVIIADGKKFKYSIDGVNWHEVQVSSTITRTWGAICYGGDKFVAVPWDNNKGVYSSDGITWSDFDLPNSRRWYDILYGKGPIGTGTFVATAGDGYIAYANSYLSNLSSWTEVRVVNADGCKWTAGCYANDKFVIASPQGYVAYSTNGYEWQTVSCGTRNWYSMVYAEGKYVAIACSSPYVMYSTDAITWTEVQLDNDRDWYDICYADNKFIILSYDQNMIAQTKHVTESKTMTIPDALSAVFSSVNTLSL